MAALVMFGVADATDARAFAVFLAHGARAERPRALELDERLLMLASGAGFTSVYKALYVSLQAREGGVVSH